MDLSSGIIDTALQTYAVNFSIGEGLAGAGWIRKMGIFLGKNGKKMVDKYGKISTNDEDFFKYGGNMVKYGKHHQYQQKW